MNTGKTILVVDDDAHALNLINEILSCQGYRVCTAATGPRAMEIYARQRPDIVLLDRDLPEMEGSQVVGTMCKIDPKARIIMLSGYGPDGIDGVDDKTRKCLSGYLAKPFSMKALKMLISEAPSD